MRGIEREGEKRGEIRAFSIQPSNYGNCPAPRPAGRGFGDVPSAADGGAGLCGELSGKGKKRGEIRAFSIQPSNYRNCPVPRPVGRGFGDVLSAADSGAGLCGELSGKGKSAAKSALFPFNRPITSIALHRAPLDGDSVTCYPLRTAERVCAGN